MKGDAKERRKKRNELGTYRKGRWRWEEDRQKGEEEEEKKRRGENWKVEGKRGKEKEGAIQRQRGKERPLLTLLLSIQYTLTIQYIHYTHSLSIEYLVYPSRVYLHILHHHQFTQFIYTSTSIINGYYTPPRISSLRHINGPNQMDSWRAIGKDGVTRPANRKTKALDAVKECAGLRHPSFPRRPERWWRAFPGAPCGSVELLGGIGRIGRICWAARQYARVGGYASLISGWQQYW